MRTFTARLRELAAAPVAPSAAEAWSRSALVPWAVRTGVGLAPLIEAFERQDTWLTTELAARTPQLIGVRDTLLALEIYTCYRRAAPTLVAAPLPPRLDAAHEVAVITAALQHEYNVRATAANASFVGPNSGVEMFLLPTGAVSMVFR